jgi:L-fuconolactonase
MTLRVDAHQHFWHRAKADYPWLTPAAPALYADFFPRDLEPLLRAAGIHQTVLVQAANSSDDTVAMLTQAEEHDWIGAVVGWVPLLDHALARRALERYTRHPKFRGVRHLIHDEPDPDWIIQPAALDGLRLLAEFGLSFDVVAVYPNHLKHVPALAEQVPGLPLIIDHLAKPPIRDRQMGAWAEQLALAAQYPQVYAKISGLNTAAAPAWAAADLRPYIEFAIEAFGPGRVLWGSDWPVCNLQGDYAQVWNESVRALEGLSAADRDLVLGGTAASVYRLGPQSGRDPS